MKAKIIKHEIREVDNSIILYMTYEHKGAEGIVSVIDLPELPNSKVIKQYVKTTEKAINEELQKKADSENTLKKEMKAKALELNEMRKFVNSRSHDKKSLEKAIKEFKQLKNV